MTADGIEILLEKKEVNTFIIVSGDSDFTTLIMKLKNNNKKIIGISEYSQSTSKSLQKCCDEFYIYNENSSNENRICDIEFLKDTVRLIFERNESTHIDLSEFKYTLLRIDSGFNERNYGFTSFSKFVKSLGICKLHWIESQVFVSLN